MPEQSPSPRPRPVGQFCFVRLPYLITGTLFLGAIAVNIANVIGRYIFSAPIFWAEEVLVFIIVWSVFLAAATITYRGEHINMDLFYAKFPVMWKWIVNTVIAAAFIVATSIVTVQSYKVVELYVRTGDKSVAADVPLIIPHAAILVGFALMLVAVVIRLPSYIKGDFR
jgi:TRAP-type C4-dicarboxylate transport system permease small subunit